MKHLFLALYLLLFTLVACDFDGRGEETTTSPDSTATDNAIVLTDYASLVQEVILKEAGVVRGFRFGDTVMLVQDYERAKLLEDSLQAGQFITYTVPLEDENEMVDIRYDFDKENKISGFLIDVFRDDVDESHNQFVKYFNDKYGKSLIATPDSVYQWESVKGYKVLMSKEKVAIAPGLRIQFVTQISDDK